MSKAGYFIQQNARPEKPGDTVYAVLPTGELSWRGKRWTADVENERLKLTHVAQSSNEDQVRRNDANEISKRRCDIVALEKKVAALAANLLVDAKTAATEIELLLAVRNNHAREIAKIESADRTFTRTETTIVITLDPFVWYAPPTSHQTFVWIPIQAAREVQQEAHVAERREVCHMNQVEPICGDF